ncbi:MAG: radical SAM protein [Candidatus Omnitrophica bacterium]|nr:radical SAM protein [Candidatus Omnitrophota bacterium]MDD5552718.1 radical SAM protein [Candidatus Omnitrophota bacterium]
MNEHPSYCCFSVTLKCLMQCRACYIWKQKEDFSRELPAEKWKEALTHLPKVLDKKTDIIITGGEPLLKEGLIDLISHCSRIGYRVSLQTNAFLIDDELARKLADAGLWRVCISLYSLKEEVHDYLRGRKGSYAKVFKAMDYLSKIGPDIGINIQTIIMDVNLEEAVDMADWVQEDGRIDYILYLAPMFPFGAGRDVNWFKNDGYKFMWPQDTAKAKRAMERITIKKARNKKIANTSSQLKMFAKYFEDPLCACKNLNCTIGERDINIDPYGDVYLCFSKGPIGNVRDNTIDEIWHSREAARIRSEIAGCKKFCHFLLNCSFKENDYTDYS